MTEGASRRAARARVGLVAACLAALGAAACAEGTAGIGAACAEKGDCASGLCLTASRFGEPTGWTGGACSEPCDAGAPCPDGAVCAALEDGGWCLAPCGDGAACRDGYVCQPAWSACVPDCRAGWPCPEAYPCAADGLCRDPEGGLEPPSGDSPDGAPPLGQPCGGDGDCAAGFCAEEVATATGVAWTDGLCTQACALPCPPGFPCLATPLGPLCVPGCGPARPCREGYVCALPAGGCLPDCRLGAPCPRALVCRDDGLCAPGGRGPGPGPGPGPGGGGG